MHLISLIKIYCIYYYIYMYLVVYNTLSNEVLYNTILDFIHTNFYKWPSKDKFLAPPLSHSVIFAASNLKLQDICYGSVILRGMYRLCSRIRVQKCQNEVYDFFTLSKLMIAKLPQIDVERWSVTTWVIWNAQNKFYFEKSLAHP